MAKNENSNANDLLSLMQKKSINEQVKSALNVVLTSNSFKNTLAGTIVQSAKEKDIKNVSIPLKKSKQSTLNSVGKISETKEKEKDNKAKELIGKNLDKEKRKASSHTYILAKELTLNGDPNIVTNAKNSLFKSSSDYKTRQEKKKEQKRQETIDKTLQSLLKTTKAISVSLGIIAVAKSLEMIKHITSLLNGTNKIVDWFNWLKKEGLPDFKNDVGNFFNSVKDMWNKFMDFSEKNIIPLVNGMNSFIATVKEIKEWVYKFTHPGKALANVLNSRSGSNSITYTHEMENVKEGDLPSNDFKFDMDKSKALINKESDLSMSKFVANLMNKQDKQHLIGDEISDLLNIKNVNQDTVRIYNKDNGGTYFVLPIDTQIIEKGKAKTKGLCIALRRYNEPDSPVIIVTGILHIEGVVNTKIPANTPICVLGPKGEIIGDLDGLISSYTQNFKDFDLTKYINNLNKDENTLQKNYEDYRKNKSTNDQIISPKSLRNINRDMSQDTISAATGPVNTALVAYRELEEQNKQQAEKLFGLSKKGVKYLKDGVSSVFSDTQSKNVQQGLNNTKEMTLNKGKKEDLQKQVIINNINNSQSGNVQVQQNNFTDPNRDQSGRLSYLIALN